jgi:sugar lactone lactonase YvrE
MSIRLVGVALGICLLVSGVLPAQESAEKPPCEPKLLVRLPEICPTPDGMALDDQGNIILSCPNYGDQTHPAVLMKITPENKVRLFCQMPVHAETGVACPMGIDFGPDGDLFVADNQGWVKPNDKGRVLRLDIEDGRWVGASIVAWGMGHPNGVKVHNGKIYVTHSMITKDPDDGMLVSGVYRFDLDAPPVKVKNTLDDPNLLVKIKTLNKDCQYGADGLVFDRKGNLYVANFGDATIHKIAFDEQGNVAKEERFAKDDRMKSADGICIDKNGNIYVADFSNNAICLVAPDGKVQVLAKSPDCDGSDGGLDQPGEPIVRGEELIISNFDVVTGPDKVNSRHDDFQNLSVIRPPTLTQPKAAPKEEPKAEEKAEPKTEEKPKSTSDDKPEPEAGANAQPKEKADAPEPKKDAESAKEAKPKE